jgi:peptide/nickel transport system substrate-binding protein
MNKFLVQLSFLFAAAVFLVGCGKNQAASQPEKSAASYPLADPPLVAKCHPGIRGGRLVVASFADPKTFNPITANDMTSQDIYRFLFASLLGFDMPSQTVEPGLADWWTNSPDGKTWTFRLRKNLHWSDGAPITADDVIFTWKVICDPKIPNPYSEQFLVNGKTFTVTKVNDLTIRVVTPQIYAPFLENFGAGIPIIPKHILARAVADGTFESAYSTATPARDIICSGPFVIKQYKPSEYTLMVRNPYFFEVDSNRQRLPYLDSIIYTVVPDMNAVSLRMLTGESDADDTIQAYEYGQFKADALKSGFRLLEPGIGLEKNFFWFNENTNINPKTGRHYVDPKKLKWFRNEKFRQAVSYAINRKAIIKSIYSGRAIPAYGFVTPGNKKWYDSDIKKYPYNPAKALELLKEIGIEDRNGDGTLEDTNGNPIKFVFNTNTGNDAREKTALMIQTDLNNLGFKVIFQPVEFTTLINKIYNTYDYDCMLLGLAGGSTDPSSSISVLKSSGYTQDWFPLQKTPSTKWEARIDALMDAELNTLDYNERKKDFDEVQEILAEEQPMIFTVTPYYYAAIRTNIGNARPTAMSYYRVTWNAEELYFKK